MVRFLSTVKNEEFERKEMGLLGRLIKDKIKRNLLAQFFDVEWWDAEKQTYTTEPRQGNCYVKLGVEYKPTEKLDDLADRVFSVRRAMLCRKGHALTRFEDGKPCRQCFVCKETRGLACGCALCNFYCCDDCYRPPTDSSQLACTPKAAKRQRLMAHGPKGSMFVSLALKVASSSADGSAVGLTPSSKHEADKTVRVVVRGHLLREGGRQTLKMRGKIELLSQAIASWHRYLLEPMFKIGYSVAIVIDITCPAWATQEVQSALAPLVARANFGTGSGIRLSPEPFGSTQLFSLLETTRWMRTFQQPSNLIGDFFLRADILLKKEVNPLVWFDENLCIFPFETQVGGPADQLYFIPCRHGAAFEKSLKFLSSTYKSPDLKAVSLHYIHEVNCLDGELDYAQPFVADADSSKEGNPLYRIFGRREALVRPGKWVKADYE
jgi:hypothetical protein